MQEKELTQALKQVFLRKGKAEQVSWFPCPPPPQFPLKAIQEACRRRCSVLGLKKTMTSLLLTDSLLFWKHLFFSGALTLLLAGESKSFSQQTINHAVLFTGVSRFIKFCMHTPLELFYSSFQYSSSSGLHVFIIIIILRISTVIFLTNTTIFMNKHQSLVTHLHIQLCVWGGWYNRLYGWRWRITHSQTTSNGAKLGKKNIEEDLREIPEKSQHKNTRLYFQPA